MKTKIADFCMGLLLYVLFLIGIILLTLYSLIPKRKHPAPWMKVIKGGKA